MKLAGIRVVEIGQVLAAPFAGMIFADLGAEVIKVEKPGGGDDARTMGPEFRDGASMTFHDVNRGKRSVQVDLKSAEGRAQLERLLADADVLIHNLRPGEAARMGVDAATLMPRFPRLVYCEITAFGHTGPRRLQPGYEPLLQAYSGLVSMNGSPEGPPARMGASLVDFGTGMWSVIGILAALRERDATGRGTLVNTSLLESALTWGSPRIHALVNQGQPSLRHGTAHPGLVPYQAFDHPDGALMICCGNDRLFAKLAGVLGQPQWASDARYATNRQRLQHRAELVADIHAALATAPRAHWQAVLEAAGVPVSPVHEFPEVVGDAQVRALDMIREVGGEGFVLAGLPLSFDGVRPPVDRPAPRLGEANAQYLGPGAPS